ncbi:MAG: ACT domain-containing protein, partial [Archaeoglobaceae archaeon]
LEPLIAKKIPVRIKNTFNPDALGTVISDKVEGKGDVVKALSIIEKSSIVNISGAGFDFAEIMADIFRRLAENKVNVIMVAQSSSELNLSIVVDAKDSERAYNALKGLENGVTNVKKIENVSIISAVGAGMAGTPGVAGRIFSALGKNGINIVMISQSCSEYNISFAIDNKDGIKALRVIHDEFNLGN